MAKDFTGTMAYWLDPHDGSGPDNERDKELFFSEVDSDPKQVVVYDIRGKESDFCLNIHGFEAITLPVKDRISTYEEDDKEYFEEMSELIKTRTGATQVILFGRNIRKLPRGALLPHEFIAGGQIQAPAPRPHVDFSARTAEHEAKKRVPSGEDLIKSSTSFQLLNIWRPLKTIHRDPLVLSETTSVPNSDYVELKRDKTFGKDAGYALSLVKCEEEGRHRWWYWSEMKVNEVLMFKNYDSRKGEVKGKNGWEGRAWRCAHTSIAIPGTEVLEARESYEIRALVGY